MGKRRRNIGNNAELIDFESGFAVHYAVSYGIPHHPQPHPTARTIGH